MTSDDHFLITMLASNASAGLARTLTRARLHKWDYTDILDIVFLVVSELVTNATEATPHREIKFRLSRDTAGILIAVWDSSERLPRPNPAKELTLATLDLSEDHWDDDGGWGLPLVTALASECGYTTDPAGGKWVWARLKPR